MIRYIILVIVVAGLAGQTDSAVVKYFPTGLTRGMILEKPADRKQVKDQSHFKAFYSPQGELFSVEYIPAKTTAGKPSKEVKPSKYFARWYPWQRKLVQPLKPGELKGRPYYGAVFTRANQIRRIDVFDRNGVRQWIYQIRWNRKQTRAVYAVESPQNLPLTDLDRFLFVPDLSELRADWQARFSLRQDKRPQVVEIRDKLGQLLYYYKFGYGHDGPNRFITAAYYRADSSLTGYHEIFFKSGSNRPDWILYYDRRKRLQKRIEFEWDAQRSEVIITETNPAGSLISKRVSSFKG